MMVASMVATSRKHGFGVALYRKRWCLHVIINIVVITSVCVHSFSFADPTEAKTTLIWIVLDACRANNLSCYGYDRLTSPNLEILAGRGVLFENHFSQGTLTASSVPSYMAGKYFPANCLVERWTGKFNRKSPRNEKLLSEILKSNGYRTVLITSHIFFITQSCRLACSFDEYLGIPPPGSQAYAPLEALLPLALAELVLEDRKPLFLYIHAMDTHFPHNLEPSFDKWVEQNSESSELSIESGVPKKLIGSNFSSKDIEHLRGCYDGSISYSDAQLGVFLKELERLSLLDNTIVVVSSDHGEALGENGSEWGHGKSSCDEIIHVPLIMTGPGLPRGIRVPSFTENVDIVPTVVELLGLQTGAQFNGKSLLPVIRSPHAPPLHDCIFTKRLDNGFGTRPTFVLRTSRFKYEYSASGKERLFAVPDTITGRTVLDYSSLENYDEVLTMFRTRVHDHYMPLWKIYNNLPKWKTGSAVNIGEEQQEQLKALGYLD